MQQPLKQVGEKELENLIEKHGDDAVLYTVHAVSGWNSNDDQVFDSWTVLKETSEDGETELRHFENTGRDDGKSAKEKAKSHARKLARENDRPAVVAIETRNFEVHRAEVAE